MTLSLDDARKRAREVMYDDQLEAIERIVLAVIGNPHDPSLPFIAPPLPETDPETGIHPQGFAESQELSEAPSPLADYERGWREGRAAAVEALESLRRKTMDLAHANILVTALQEVCNVTFQGSPLP